MIAGVAGAAAGFYAGSFAEAVIEHSQANHTAEILDQAQPCADFLNYSILMANGQIPQKVPQSWMDQTPCADDLRYFVSHRSQQVSVETTYDLTTADQFYRQVQTAEQNRVSSAADRQYMGLFARAGLVALGGFAGLRVSMASSSLDNSAARKNRRVVQTGYNIN